LRALGDPVQHYAARATAITCAGHIVGAARPTYVIFDTGTTGLSLSRDLYEAAFEVAGGKSPWSNVRVCFTTNDGRVQELGARNPITLPVDVPWRDFAERCSLVVVGLSFLEGSVLTIDTTTEQVCAAQLLPPLPALLAVF